MEENNEFNASIVAEGRDNNHSPWLERGKEILRALNFFCLGHDSSETKY
jgi:hypothetical protein